MLALVPRAAVAVCSCKLVLLLVLLAAVMCRWWQGRASVKVAMWRCWLGRPVAAAAAAGAM